ncbi:hypothetical protein MGMO_60c00400 [Methyloglobulus morosus KoM1]|uniref:Uncharacterized protein n=1 Tax=Methyloglobulus morosus KoM1 TaxID=1116472 RepID=V5BGE4_9GAMM|nr:hypothetical protein MGMO_60c00400 [Methyloglobulus morosus KoM1]
MPYVKRVSPSPAGEGWGEEDKIRKITLYFPLILTFSLKGEGTELSFNLYLTNFRDEF